MKKKVLIAFLLLFITTTVWAAPGSFEGRLKNIVIPVEVHAQGQPLEDVLAMLSEQSGVRIISVPEIAGIKIDLHTLANQTLDKVFEMLSHKYSVTYYFNEEKNAILVLKGTYEEEYNTRLLASTPKLASLAEQGKGGALPSAPAPAPGYHSSLSFNTEEYKAIYDNSFQDALSTPVSTFSIDVDTASYSNMRRFINTGKLPPVDAVRTEEFLNYFKYHYPQPIGGHPFSVTTEVNDCPWQPDHKLMMIGLQGKDVKTEELPPSNLVFLIDVSGSMGEPNKLPLLQTAFKMLVKQLRAQDKVSIVVYAGAAGLVLEPTSGNEKTKIIERIDSLQAGGSTAGGEGIELAYKIAKEQFVTAGNNRVILATDGDFNVGASSEGELLRLIEKRRNDGVFLTVLGFGMGNVKDNKMEMLADKGNGNYAYIDNALEAKKVMVSQFAGTLFTIAKDVKLQLEFNPAQVKSYRLIGYENRVLENRDFNDDKKDAGDMGAGHSVTALYEIIPANSPEVIGTVDPLVYQQSTIVPSEDLLQVKIRYKKPMEDSSSLFTQPVSTKEINANTPSENFQFAGAVAEYTMLLRNSEFKGHASYQQVLAQAKDAKGQDEEGYRAEFIKLVEVTQLLDEKNK